MRATRPTGPGANDGHGAHLGRNHVCGRERGEAAAGGVRRGRSVRAGVWILQLRVCGGDVAWASLGGVGGADGGMGNDVLVTGAVERGERGAGGVVDRGVGLRREKMGGEEGKGARNRWRPGWEGVRSGLLRMRAPGIGEVLLLGRELRKGHDKDWDMLNKQAAFLVSSLRALRRLPSFMTRRFAHPVPSYRTIMLFDFRTRVITSNCFGGGGGNIGLLSLMDRALCTLYSVLCTLYSVLCTLYTFGCVLPFSATNGRGCMSECGTAAVGNDAQPEKAIPPAPKATLAWLAVDREDRKRQENFLEGG